VDDHALLSIYRFAARYCSRIPTVRNSRVVSWQCISVAKCMMYHMYCSTTQHRSYIASANDLVQNAEEEEDNCIDDGGTTDMISLKLISNSSALMHHLSFSSASSLSSDSSSLDSSPSGITIRFRCDICVVVSLSNTCELPNIHESSASSWPTGGDSRLRDVMIECWV